MRRNYIFQKILAAVLAIAALAAMAGVMTACSDNDDNHSEEPMLKGVIASYSDYGAAILNITEADMTKAGFALGDNIGITVDNKAEIVMPYFDGYYIANGEYVCLANSNYPGIFFTANNIGLPQELRGLEGHAVTIRMNKKGGSRDVQEAMGMRYTNNRDDYPNLSDEAYANARMVRAGNIADGVLHRSSSPFSNGSNRAYEVSAYLENNGVKTVLNLTDTEEKMMGYEMPAYSRTLWEGGNVILCPVKTDPTSDDYNNRLIAALKELPTRSAPYDVHCMEGKDRTGYVCALLEGLCGATYDEMVADYLITYYNYYGITPEKDPDVCNTLLRLNLNPCLMHYAGVSDEAQLPQVDYAKAFSDYLLSHGMSRQQLDALVNALTTSNG
ncbi:MAG: tyrosine-protein phosphatase [Bacteroidaceae bacterium]|nr:tyrosine-protein phosphatase [Bacteroidaceae bacterium]